MNDVALLLLIILHLVYWVSFYIIKVFNLFFLLKSIKELWQIFFLLFHLFHFLFLCCNPYILFFFSLTYRSFRRSQFTYFFHNSRIFVASLSQFTYFLSQFTYFCRFALIIHVFLSLRSHNSRIFISYLITPPRWLHCCSEL